jgi:hypothetical protein
MNSIWMKITGLLTGFKQACTAQLWLAGLLTPLILLAALGVMKYSGNKTSTFDTKNRILLSEVQLSSTEVALIVAKPLTELLLIKVYFDDETSSGQANALVAKLSEEDSLPADQSGAILAFQPRRNRSNVLVYVSYCNTKKNQAITELV